MIVWLFKAISKDQNFSTIRKEGVLRGYNIHGGHSIDVWGFESVIAKISCFFRWSANLVGPPSSRKRSAAAAYRRSSSRVGRSAPTPSSSCASTAFTPTAFPTTPTLAPFAAAADRKNDMSCFTILSDLIICEPNIFLNVKLENHFFLYFFKMFRLCCRLMAKAINRLFCENQY